MSRCACRVLDRVWRPVGRVVRFVIVHHPQRGTIFLLCTDLALEPLQILTLYGYRFKIELGLSIRLCMSWVPMPITSGWQA